MIPPKALRKIEKRLERLKIWRFRSVAQVPLEIAETLDHFYQPPDHLDYKEAPFGLQWGSNWSTAWFRGTVRVPEECEGQTLFYRLGTVAEMMIFLEGIPHCIMNPARPEGRLLQKAEGGEAFPMYIEAYAGHLYPGGHPFPGKMRLHQCCHSWADKKFPHTLESSDLLVTRPETDKLFYEADTLFDLAKILGENTLRRAQIIDGLNQAIDMVPMHWESEEELEAGCQEARARLAPLLEVENGPTTPFVGMVGHAHMDIAWLWPLKETIRKTARTFSGMLNLMEDYPELTFMQSQPVMIQMAEDHYPALLPKVKAAVASGAWEPNGGMWVESDCNLPSGESLVRQFLEGRKKTMEAFGYAGDTLWLPDVFGYSAALPQIMKGCGIANFVTAKLNSNDVNPLPYAAFDWEGIDGTRVFAHRLVSKQRGYNGHVTPKDHQDCWDDVPQKELQDRTLLSVGFGDGGGGVNRDMCEYARRMTDLEGCVKTGFVNASDFLAELREQTADERPCWAGELYFEAHRGTYTSQARSKRYNRRLEFLLQEVELLYSMAAGTGLDYPSEALQKHWRTLLTNQFHDILAGSSIRSVHERAEEEYAAMEDDLNRLKGAAVRHIAGSTDAAGSDGTYAVFNPLSWTREDIVELDGAEGVCGSDGNALPVQQIPGDQPRMAVAVTTPPLSITTLRRCDETTQPTSPFRHEDNTLETPFYTVTFDDAGKITSLVDKEVQRELVQAGRRLNDLYIAEDIPIVLDAWNIDEYYRDTVRAEDRLQSREVSADGPLYFSLRSEYAVGRKSKLTQEMVFYARNRRIDFRTEVDWQETHQLLKAGFPLDINADQYRSEIQFGHVCRPAHRNTTFEQARFEICAHKWIDISEGNYGVALLNDCKYGHDALDGMWSITLLKAAIGPDELADRGHHEFTYSLQPHCGDFSVESVVRPAYELNRPVTAVKSMGTDERIFCQVSNPNVVLETVKKAEEDDALVLRLYEAGNTRGPVTLAFEAPVRSAAICNMVESQDQPIEAGSETVKMTMRPFEVKTLKVCF